MIDYGIVLVAFGKDAYYKQAKLCIKSIKQNSPGINITVFTDCNNTEEFFKLADNITKINKNTGKWLIPKFDAILNSPYKNTLYLDTDTYVVQDISHIFDILKKYDVAMSHGHLRIYRLNPMKNKPYFSNIPKSFTTIQGGVLLSRNDKRTNNFWNNAKQNYIKYDFSNNDDDQAFIRKELWENDEIKLCILPTEYNLFQKHQLIDNSVYTPYIIHYTTFKEEDIENVINTKLGHLLDKREENNKMTKTFDLLSCNTGHGNASVNNNLGYNGDDNKIVSKYDIKEYETISAHSPSTIIINLHKPAMLSGLLNYTSKLNRANSVEFFVDLNYVGCITNPADKTEDIYLEPGIHELKITNNGNNHGFRHTVWLLKETEEKQNREIKIVSPLCENYDNYLNYSRILSSSARKQNIWIDFIEVEKDTQKIESVIKCIEEIKSNCKYIMFCDHKSFLTKHVKDVVDTFVEMNVDVVISSEKTCNPISCQEWTQSFTPKTCDRNYLSDRCFIGKADVVLEILKKILSIQKDITCEIFKNEYGSITDKSTILYHKEQIENSNLVWQWIYKTKIFDIKIDDECKIFCNLLMENQDELSQKSEASVFHCPTHLGHMLHKYSGVLDALY